jgi:hypothetical protein
MQLFRDFLRFVGTALPLMRKEDAHRHGVENDARRNRPIQAIRVDAMFLD